MEIAAGVNYLNSTKNNPFQTKIIFFSIQGPFQRREREKKKRVAQKLKSS
jgi:hypothetical protein